MAQIAFVAENKRSTGGPDFPKIRIEKQGQVARIVCLENPVMEWVHNLNAPKVVNGRPKMETRKRKDETSYEVYETDFIGTPICTGDPDILAERGKDPKNCVVCKLAEDNPDATRGPQRRFAMHVIQYQTKTLNDPAAALPVQVAAKVWRFTDKVFNQLVDAASEFGNLQEHDVILKLTGDPNYQVYDVQVVPTAVWLKDEATKALVSEVFKTNRCDDLTLFCGKPTERKWMQTDVDKITERWTLVARAESGQVSLPTPPDFFTPSASEAPDLAAGLDDLLGGVPAQSSAPAPVAASKTPIDLEDLLS